MDYSAELTFAGNIRIVVPYSLNLITPYVLEEQQDWFEDEIKFLRHFLLAGQKTIDIGANYGVYTLTMAQAVGGSGNVWAFEPTSSTAKFLADGVAANGFSQVVLEQSALSNRCGTAQLSLNANSELNSLVCGNQAARSVETVPLFTLDQCMEKYGWEGIDFVKIDAEGEEGNILRGGRRFFAEQSPLVMYEIKDGSDLHLELVQSFVTLGYASYRLVPGLDLLVPFDMDAPVDNYLLNLFCCKQDCAERLAARGFLLDSVRRCGNVLERVMNRDSYDWHHTIARLPYGIQLARLWEQTMAEGNGAEVSEALSLYAVSRDASLHQSVRFEALETSLDIFRGICERQPSYMRLSSLARVARDYGARRLAVNALRQLGNFIGQQNMVNLREPFLAPSERFDSIDPGEAVGNWSFASVLEEDERLSSFSSFYTGSAARKRLEAIHALGFGSDEMMRRLNLLQKRFGFSAS